MKLLINRKRLSESFEFDPSTYKGLKVGDLILIPQWQMENIESLFVKVTGFNREHDVVHWTGKSHFGGYAHSGTHYSDILWMHV